MGVGTILGLVESKYRPSGWVRVTKVGIRVMRRIMNGVEIRVV